MIDSIFSSNNEIGLLKSVGPFKIPTADMSIAGVKYPITTKISTPFAVGILQTYGSRILIEQIPSPSKKPFPQSYCSGIVNLGSLKCRIGYCGWLRSQRWFLYPQSAE